jgi:hypothetical protein
MWTNLKCFNYQPQYNYRLSTIKIPDVPANSAPIWTTEFCMPSLLFVDVLDALAPDDVALPLVLVGPEEDAVLPDADTGDDFETVDEPEVTFVAGADPVVVESVEEAVSPADSVTVVEGLALYEASPVAVA